VSFAEFCSLADETAIPHHADLVAQTQTTPRQTEIITGQPQQTGREYKAGLCGE
jgi:hypothetical protein